MRSGIIFAAGSVALAWVLTTVAVAAPLTGAWRSFDVVWSGVRDQFEGALGSLTNVWTVNDAQRMRWLIEAGVNGLITDAPDVGRSVVNEWKRGTQA